MIQQVCLAEFSGMCRPGSITYPFTSLGRREEETNFEHFYAYGRSCPYAGQSRLLHFLCRSYRQTLTTRFVPHRTKSAYI
jgi:hypothetical protein